MCVFRFINTLTLYQPARASQNRHYLPLGYKVSSYSNGRKQRKAWTEDLKRFACLFCLSKAMKFRYSAADRCQCYRCVMTYAAGPAPVYVHTLPCVITSGQDQTAQINLTIHTSIIVHTYSTNIMSFIYITNSNIFLSTYSTNKMSLIYFLYINDI